jgi:tripeptidyl-peptidase I
VSLIRREQLGLLTLTSPPCIKALYDIPNAHLSQPVNVMGLFEEYDAFSQADIDLFFKYFSPNIPQGTSPKVDSIDGGTAPVKASSVRNSGESDIDLDLTYSLIYPQTVRSYPNEYDAFREC